MDKLKYIRVQQQNGSYTANIPVGVDDKNVDMSDGSTLRETMQEVTRTFTSIDNTLTGLQSTKVNRDQIGNPTVARKLSDMTDQSLVYVYIGDGDDGGIKGNWYAYDPVEGKHVSGGAYNSQVIQTDKSLSIANMAADAGAVGDELLDLRTRLGNVTIDVDDLGLYQDADTGYVYPTYRGNTSQNGIPLASSGGGGGGGGADINNAVFSASNTTGWLAKTIAKDTDCNVSITWSSLEDEISTGNGAARITVNNVVKGTIEVQQGEFTLNVAPYLAVGSNVVKIRVSDVYNNGQTISFNITVADFSISSTFVTTTPFTEQIVFPFTPVGEAAKTVYFILDGVQSGTIQTTASNRQLSYKIPAQRHGGHTLRCYFEVQLNEDTIRSNELYFEFMFLEDGNNTPIITSSFTKTTAEQYSSVIIPYRVYDPTSTTANVELYLNNVLVSTQQTGRQEQSFTFRANTVGTNTFKIQTGNVSKTITFNVTESEIDVNPVTEDLALYLTPQGRSNNEAADVRQSWSYNGIAATLQNFNWRIDGWLTDSDGINVLRLTDNARVTIPYKIFETDFKTTGKTIEFEFATRDVSDYNAVILSCFNDNIGLKLTSQNVLFKGAQTEVSTLYKDNEHIRVSFVIQKQNENRLILIYINGIMSRAIQYASGERFTQLTPVGISIGSDDCGIDIYNIRIYNNNLTRKEILDNWIADTQIGSTLLDRYTHNNIYDEYNNITIPNLPNDLPYMTIEASVLPQFKGDKKTVNGTYTDPVSPSNSFTFDGCEIDVQGTSSAVYYRKNYDLKFKNGFVTNSGKIDTYALRRGSIPFNRFVIKADVASSESTNNTGLTMFYNDTCPYKTPEMLENSKVRWGIEGIPIVVFWYNPDTQTTSFLGKYNFNLPKRAKTPLGYSGDDESWEVERNNSANVKFQDDDFDAMSWSEVDQTYYPTWYDDFEARFPDDTWRDYSKLKELISWVKSTWRNQATNETLPEPVTYTLNTTATVNEYSSDTSYTVVDEKDSSGKNTGNKIFTFTKDTPAYRLTKFKAELPNYVEIDSAVFYYLFTELFLMIDSRAKNMFIGFHGSAINDENRAMDRKAVFEPYDMDTAIGTNNSGVLMFGYYLEDTDKVSSIISGGQGGSQANVFNAQDSVFWVNLRDSSRAEITQMYRSLRTSVWSYKAIETMYQNHQAKWPEAIFNEDAYIKYLIPLVEPVTTDETTGQLIKTDRYLTMLQGSKAEQRKWWLSNRFRYMDSKFATGDASNNRITARFFNNGTLTVTPAIDMYVGVYFGGGTTVALKRTTANTSVSFEYQAGTTAQQMETWIDSGDMITDLGDLSIFLPNELDFSRATKIKRLQIGSTRQGYSNSHLTTLDVRNSTLLEYIDLRNCPNLGITVNLEGSPRLKEAYFENTSITGVDLVEGCPIETLHLPSTVTTLTLVNLNKLTDFVILSYSNVTRLILANIDANVVNPITVLNDLQANSLVNIQGFYLDVNSAADIDSFYAKLDTMKGVTRQKNTAGEWIYTEYDKPQISGTIHIAALTGAQIAAYKERYPYINIDADGLSSTVTYMTYDGSSVITTQTVVKNAQNPHPNATYSGRPSRTSTAQYDYTFAGWSTTPNGAAESNAQNDIQGDKTLYAAYTSTVRTYPVYWVKSSTDGGGTLQTLNNVAYGTVLSNSSYTGPTPTTTQGSAQEYPFEGWTPAFAPITGSTTYTAKFGSPTRQIEDTWEQIGEAIDNGTYKTKYKIGWYKPLDMGSEGTINMQIVAFDADTLTAGGTAPITFVAMELLNTSRSMNSSNTNANSWAQSSIRTTSIPTTIYTKIDPSVRIRIQSVEKTYYNYTTKSTLTSSDKVWIPSVREMFGEADGYENSGVIYSDIFKDDNSRKKHQANTTSYIFYWLRSAHSGSSRVFRVVSSGGGVGDNSASDANGVCIGFCLGAVTPNVTEISDSWDTIIANIDNRTYKKYDIGQYKPLDLGTEGTINMQIVAMNADELASGGYAPLTFLGMELLSNKHPMNSSDYSTSDWSDCLMRSYLSTTIKPLMPISIQQRLQKVLKLSRSQKESKTISTLDTLWIPSISELFGAPTSYEPNSVYYKAIYPSGYDNNIKRKKYQNGNVIAYWTRTNGDLYNEKGTFYTINTAGALGSNNPVGSTTQGVCLGFCLGYETETIDDDWSTILSNTNYATDYSIGDTKSLSINGTNHLMQIVAFNSDVRTDGNGTAGITWIEKDLFTKHRMNATADNTGGWPATEMRSWLRETVLPTLPEVVRNSIVEVNKTYYDYNGGSGITSTQADTIWIPSVREMFGNNSNYENSGVDYTSFFNSNSARIKKLNSTANTYWLRSARSGINSQFHNVNGSGGLDYYSANVTAGVCIGFCTN